MKCPKCSHEETHVLDSREVESDRVVRRRRECAECEGRFTTYERVEVVNFSVRKKSGELEPYDRSKIERGIWIALGKRVKNKDVVTKVIDQLEAKWGALNDKEISTEQIGEDVLEKLLEIDEVAFIRFASVHKRFKDIKEFAAELQKLL